MKLTSLCLCLAALSLGSAFSGCESAPQRQPRSTQTFVLSPDHPAPDAEIGLVSAIRLVLPAPAEGSSQVWEIVSNNNKVLDQMGPMKAVPAGEAADGKPAIAVSFYALRPGKSILRFDLLDPKLAEAVPAATCVITVRVVE